MFAFSSVLMMLLAGTPAPNAANAMGKARSDFTSCLSAYMRDAMERKMDAGEYKTGLKTKCADKEATFRTAILAADKADGMTAKSSASDADEQVQEYLDKFSEEYDEYLSGAK